MSEPPFLTKEQVLYIHEQQLADYGGQAGVRDEGLLDSALAQPASSFGGQYRHRFPYGMAAAYAYHISENQPFLDGNKRVGLVDALVFLDACGIEIYDDAGELYQAMKAIGSRALSKEGFEKLLMKLARTAPHS